MTEHAKKILKISLQIEDAPDASSTDEFTNWIAARFRDEKAVDVFDAVTISAIAEALPICREAGKTELTTSSVQPEDSDVTRKARYSELSEKADAIWEAAKPLRDALEKFLMPYHTLKEEMDEIAEYATKCEGCGTIVIPGDQCLHDDESGITLCEECAPSWEDVLRDPSSFYLLTDGGLEYYTTETAQAAIDKLIADGGSITDKFGISSY